MLVQWNRRLNELLTNRKLQVDIVTIFMILIASTSFFIISFTYSRNYQSIMKFSRTTIQRTAELILVKVDALIHEFERIPQTADGLIVSRSDVSMNNRQLISYMKNLVRYHINLTAFYVGTTDGSLLEIINLEVAQQKSYLSDPSKPLPKDALYTIRVVDRSIPNPTTVLYYYDKDFTKISEESLTPTIFDSRSRPWYVGAKDSEHVFWTDVYQYDPTNESGITVAKPIYSPSGEFIGVSGADLSLTLLSKFLEELDIGVHGRTLVLDNQTGDILLPLETKASQESVPDNAITLAYTLYQNHKKADFLFEDNGTEYLTGFNAFPIMIGNEWLITVISPLSDFFGEILRTQKQVVFISICIFLIASYFVVFFSKRISRPISVLAKEIDKIKHLDLTSTLRVRSNIKEISIMDSSIAAMRSAISSFAKYVPKEIVRQLIRQGQDIILGGEKKGLTIMFCDIVGFTPIAERLPPDVLMPLLAEYFDELSRIILENHGTIDKYIGDSIMAFWGAPGDLTNPWSHACETTLLCEYHLKTLNEQRKQKNLPEFYTRFGIDAGMVIVGNIGTNERINYTAIGDAVNSASRLQTVNNTYKTNIIISENVYQHIKEDFVTRPLDVVTVKGKQAKIKIYELIAKNSIGSPISVSDRQKVFAEEFSLAYREYDSGNKEKAKALFKEFLKKYPQDEPALIHLKKLEG